MTRLRAMPEFSVLWERRTTFADDAEYHLLCIPDLVQAKKTQRSRDWPVIELLVTIHHRENAASPTAAHVDFWLREARTPELLVELCRRFPGPAPTALPSSRSRSSHVARAGSCRPGHRRDIPGWRSSWE